MPRALQVRNVPEDVHAILKSRAALAGMSLSDYVLVELRRLARRPSRQELRARLRGREPVELRTPAAELVAEERLSR